MDGLSLRARLVAAFVGIAAIGGFLVRIFKGKKESEAKPAA